MAFKRSIFLKIAAASLAGLLAGAPTATAVSPSAGLSGTVFAGADRSPLARATVHLIGTTTDPSALSARTDAKGNFKFENLAVASYDVAVEYAGGLYLVGSPVQLSADRPLLLNLAIEKSAVARAAVSQSQRGAGGLFASPLLATLAVAGSAVALGAVVEATTSSDTDPVASHFLTR